MTQKPPDRLNKILYTVILTGLSKNPATIVRQKRSIHFYPDQFTFPVVGWVTHLNKSGEPIVVPYFPAHAVPLSFFEWKYT